jgi:ribonuclease D
MTEPVAAENVRVISRDELARLPVRRYAGRVVVIGTAAELESALRDIRGERVIGLDTETRPAFRKGESHRPSLVQIATAQAVYLLQIKRLDFSGALIEVLENPGLIKAGIGVADDLFKLRQMFPFKENGFVDLGAIARRHGITQSGVRTLAARFLELRVTKGPQTSNWANPQLTPQQVLYAATDAWICRELFLCFEKQGMLAAK